MANDNRNNRGGYSKESLVAGLTDVAIPADLTATVFTFDTPTLGNQFMELIDTTFGIHEIDHVYMYPKYGNNGRVEDFGLVLYFMTSRNGDGDISRVGGGNKNNNKGNNKVDLTSFLNNRTQSGGFRTSDNFKSKIGSISRLDRDGNIVIHADKDNPQLAVVEGDFFALMSVALKIREDSPYEFTVIECDPLDNRKNSCDYRLKITKEIQPRKKSKRSTFDYGYRDRAFAQSGRR